MKDLLRYKLCQLSLKLPNRVDASFTNITQYRDLKSKESIGIWLKNQKLLKERVSPRLFGEYKWLIDIDGNVNSWGLQETLQEAGMRVESSRQHGFIIE